MCFISMYSVLNAHLYILKNITSYTFLLVFKIVESLQCILNPTNTPREFHVETMWKRPFPRRFNVEFTWCVCREVFSPVDMTKSAVFFFFLRIWSHFLKKPLKVNSFFVQWKKLATWFSLKINWVLYWV